MFNFNIIYILVLFLCSCATPHQNIPRFPGANSTGLFDYTHQKISHLKNDLAALDDDTDLTEAKQLAETSINYSFLLADEYRLVRPPFLHNILVRIGIKDRGLCYHWTEDLMKRLGSLKLKTFRLHLGVAHEGSDIWEHSSIVVTAAGKEFNEGIVLDPWRDSGDLYWSPVMTDKYPWEER